MNSREKEDIKKLEEVFKTVHLQQNDDAVQPTLRWQNSVMLEVRHIAAPERIDVQRSSLFWPLAQLAAAVAIVLGVAFITDQSLTTLDMAVYDSEISSKNNSLVSYYSF